MKHFLSLVLALIMALSLAACGAKNAALSNGNDNPDQPQPSEEQPPDEALEREKSTDLIFLIEGMEDTVPATLYVGEGYSIYIPDEGWALEEDLDDGIQRETWESALLEDVELQVLHLGEMTLEQAQAWISAEEDEFQLIEDKRGGLGGTDERDRSVMEVRFYPSGNAMYAVLYTYPMEAAEGFGTRLSVMADTFELTKPA